MLHLQLWLCNSSLLLADAVPARGTGDGCWCGFGSVVGSIGELEGFDFFLAGKDGDAEDLLAEEVGDIDVLNSRGSGGWSWGRHFDDSSEVGWITECR